ncbi:MAG TPA: DUF362 domain-containing protein [Bryobacterales bacterium]|jgi:uncharacterized protein (DUF362 family)|nr:DUF362 domain-containing protein [Bryobacterales bacterium]
MPEMTRRQLLTMLGAAAAWPVQKSWGAPEAPAAPVSIARCKSYDESLVATLSTMFDQLGGLQKLVKGKTVTVKLNLTGDPGLRLQGKPVGSTHYTHPTLIEAFLHLADQAGAKRIRLVESCWATAGPLEEYMLDSGWRVRRFQSAAKNVEFENTNALGKGKQYSRFKVPGQAYMFPAYDLNHSYADTDVFVSMAKLKNHATCGVTLSLKNCFGMTPASIYGEDAGEFEPNESPGSGRGAVCHYGKRGPSKCSPQELHPESPREGGYRIPRIVADLTAARPIDLAIIDGIETMIAGEGPWVRGTAPAQPGLLLAGLNPVCTDAVATAVMGYDPRADRGSAPFEKCDNTLKLAEALGAGTTDLKRIEVLGVPIEQALFPFPKHLNMTG